MKVSQIYEVVNSLTNQLLGKTDLLETDCSNIVDVGNEILDTAGVDNYAKALNDLVGKQIFVNRVYKGKTPSVLMDGWEFGSVLEKVTMELPNADQNEAWDLVDGQTYNQDVFYKPTISVKYYNNKSTFKIPMSIAEKQVKESLLGIQQFNSFFSMIYNEIEKAMTVRLQELVTSTIGNFIGATIHNEYGEDSLDSKSGVRAVNLLYLYNMENGTALQASDCLKDPEFVRFMSYKMGLTADRLGTLSNTFNIGGKSRFTPKELLHTVMLAEAKRAAEVYLYNGSGQFRDEYLLLPEAETVDFWQGSGEKWEFSSTSKIDMVVSYEKGKDGVKVEASGILGVMFDRDALGVSNLNMTTTTHWNALGEFFNNYYKMEAGYFNDFNENFVVFFVA
jgi:hypothetical protein